MSNQSLRPKGVRFVDVTDEVEPPAWLDAPVEDPVLVGPDWNVAPLSPPVVPSHARPPLAPILESVRPPPIPISKLPSKFPSMRPPTPSQFPAAHEPVTLASEPPPPPPPPLPRSDTLIEDLVPRAEEEAAAALSQALADFAAERAQMLAAAEAELVELAKTICRRVLLRELEREPRLVERLVRAGLEALGESDRVTVRLGPFFAEARDSIAESLQQQGVECSVIIDAGVGRHGCQVETELGRVDESVEKRLDVLLGGSGE